jgi:uncharacterized protein
MKAMMCVGGMTREDYFKKLYNAIFNNNFAYIEKFFISKNKEKQSIAINDRLNDGETLLDRAVIRNNHKAVELLLKAGANPNIASLSKYRGDEYSFPLVTAVSYSDLKMVTMLLKAGAEVDQISIKGCALINAVKEGKIEIIQTLLDAKADVNIQFHGSTPILTAIYYNNLELVKLFVSHGADLKAADILISAIKHKNIDIIKLLLNSGVDINYGRYIKPLEAAIETKNLDIVKLLLDSENIDLGLENLLETAIKTKNIDIIQMLLDKYHNKGLDINNTKSPIIFSALATNNDIIVKYVIDHGAKLDVYSKYGATPLTHAAGCFTNNQLIIDILVASGANPNLQDKKGKYPLEAAFYSQQKEALKALILNGANPNLLDSNYIFDKSIRHIKLLLEGGAKLDLAKLYHIGGVDFIKNLDAKNKLQLFDRNDNEIILLETNAQKNNQFYQDLLTEICAGKYHFTVNIGETISLINSWSSLKQIIDKSIKAEEGYDFLSSDFVSKMQLITGDTKFDYFSSPKMLLTQASSALTDEIIGLYSLSVKRILPPDAILGIADYLSFNPYLAAVAPNYNNQNMIAHFFQLLKTPFVDVSAKQFSRDILMLLSNKGQDLIDQMLPATALKIISEERKLGVFLVKNEDSKPVESSALTVRDFPSLPELSTATTLTIRDFPSLKEVKTHISNFGFKNAATSWLNYLTLKAFKYNEVSKLEGILSKNDIHLSWHKVVFDKNTYKETLLKLHPDKGGNTQDFQDFLAIRESMHFKLSSANEHWQQLIHKSCGKAVTFSKMLNTGVNSVKFVQNPQIDLGLKLLTSSIEAISSSAGVPLYTGLTVASDWYKNGLETALLNVLVSTAMISGAKLMHPNAALGLSASAALYNLYNVAYNIMDLLVDNETKNIFESSRNNIIDSLSSIVGQNFLSAEQEVFTLEG